jgi:hypothetical protein
MAITAMLRIEMDIEEKRKRIASEKKRIDRLSYTQTIPYPYCCICFDKLTEHNILEKDGTLINVCMDCKDT